jgi:hypothetical protein
MLHYDLISNTIFLFGQVHMQVANTFYLSTLRHRFKKAIERGYEACGKNVIFVTFPAMNSSLKVT